MATEGPCCGYTKKRVVMTILFILCLALVIWMLVTTSLEEQPGSKSLNISSNATIQLAVDHRLALEFITFNITNPNSKVKKIRKPPATKVKKEKAKIKAWNFVEEIGGEDETLCKCVCGFNVTKLQISKAVSIDLDAVRP